MLANRMAIIMNCTLVDFLDVERCFLIHVVVQPVGVEQVGGGTPLHHRHFVGVATWVVVLRFVDG